VLQDRRFKVTRHRNIYGVSFRYCCQLCSS
jgi:hypothetical protein